MHHMNMQINSLAPGRSECDSKTGIFNLNLLIVIFRSSHGNAMRWMPQDLTDDKSTLGQVMAWCHQASNLHLNQCWPSSLTHICSTRDRGVNYCWLTVLVQLMPLFAWGNKWINTLRTHYICFKQASSLVDWMPLSILNNHNETHRYYVMENKPKWAPVSPVSWQEEVNEAHSGTVTLCCYSNKLMPWLLLFWVIYMVIKWPGHLQSQL